jgi:hypothetical protein
MPLIGVFVIYNSGIYQSNIPWEAKKFTYLLVILFTILLPLAMLTLLVYWRAVQDIQLNERRERFVPMFFTAVSLVLLHIILTRIIPIKLINAFTLSMTIIAFCYLLLNLLLKTSLHLIALGGITGLVAVISKVFMADLFLWLSILIMISGIVATSRIYLKAHTIPEIISGYITGFFGVFGTIYFLA